MNIKSVSISFAKLYTHANKHWLNNPQIRFRSWYSSWGVLLFLFTALSGNSFFELRLLNSEMSQLQMFDMGLNKTELRDIGVEGYFSRMKFEVHNLFHV